MAGEGAGAEEYVVTVNGKPVQVFTAEYRDRPHRQSSAGLYFFSSFDFDQPVEVVVSQQDGMNGVRVLPEGKMSHVVKDGKLSFLMKEPCKLAIEPSGKDRPLLLFGNPVEKGRPSKQDPKVLFFGPGVHRPEGGKITLESGQTLYLAEGAIVKAVVEARNAEDVTVCGRGMLDGSDWPWSKEGKGPGRFMLRFDDCRNVLVEGIMIRASFFWTVVPISCDGVTIRNIKILNSRCLNDDGINPCNSRNVKIVDCFIRSDDDCISIKGVPTGNIVRKGYPYNFPPAREKDPVEDIEIVDCIFWGDRARIIMIGPECQTKHMRNIRIHDCVVLHHGMTPFMIAAGEGSTLENIVIENMFVNSDGMKSLASVRTMSSSWMKEPIPGFLKNVTLRNISMVGPDELIPTIFVSGADDEHVVKDVSFENISVNGKILNQNSGAFQIGEFAHNVLISP